MNVFEVITNPVKFTDVLYQPNVASHSRRLPEFTWDSIAEQQAKFKILGFNENTENSNTENMILDSFKRSILDGIEYIKTNPTANVFPLNYLARMAFMARRGELTQTGITQILNDIRKEIIGYMLGQIKTDLKISHDMWNAVNELRAFGCNWSELNIIERSYQHQEANKNNQAINEGRDDREFYRGYLFRALDRNDPNQVEEALEKLSRLHVKLSQDDIAKIRENKELIVQALTIMAGNLYLNLLFDIFTWLRINGFNDWDQELFIDYYKSPVVKSILKLVKNLTFTQAMMDIRFLQVAGVNWPELYTIQKSIKHDWAKSDEPLYETETNNQDNNEQTAHSLIDDINDKVIVPNHNLEVCREFTRAVDKIRTEHIPPSAFEYLDPNKVKNILRWFRYTLSEDPYYAFKSLTFFAEARFQLTYVQRFVSEIKTDIIRFLLRYFKDGMPGRAAHHAQQLKNVGVTWPELDTIITSGRAELKRMSDAGQLEESTTNTVMAAIFKKVEERFKYSPWAAMSYLDSYGIDVDQWPALRALIEENKHQIIKLILKSLKDEIDSLTVSADLTLIKQLQAQGIDWTELNTIRRSLESEAKLKGYSL